MADRVEMWWEATADEVSGAVIARVDSIKNDMSARYERVREYYMMYGDAYGLAHDRVPLYRTLRNTLAEAIDAKVAELLQDTPRVVITLRDVGWRTVEQARLWGWYTDAAWQEQDMELLTDQCVRDAAISGIGVCVVLDEERGPVLHRIHPLDTFIDDAGCMDVDPPELIIRWRYPRHWLARRAESEEQRDAILDAPQAEDAHGRDVLEVFEAWYEGYDDVPGRHVQALRGVDTPLVDEDWDGRPPWARVRINPATQGVWGESSIERGAAAQNERSMLSDKIQEGIYYLTPKILAMHGVIPEGAWDNTPDEVVETTQPPGGDVIREIVPQAVHPEVYLREDKLDAIVYESIGASKQFATGEIPKGEESGRHARIRYVIRNRQLKRPVRQIQRFVEQCMKELVRGEGRCYERDPDHQVAVTRSGVTKNLAASMLELDVDSLQIRAKAASSLGLDAASEFEELKEQYDDQLLTREEFWYRASQLDLDGITDLETSPLRVIHEHIDDILYEGKPRQPERYLNTDMAMAIGVKSLMKAQCDGLEKAKPERMAMLRQWVDLVHAEKERQMQEAAARAAAAAPPPPPGMMPPGPGLGLPSPPIPGMGPGGPVPPPGAVPPPPVDIAGGNGVPLQ